MTRKGTKALYLLQPTAGLCLSRSCAPSACGFSRDGWAISPSFCEGLVPLRGLSAPGPQGSHNSQSSKPSEALGGRSARNSLRVAENLPSFRPRSNACGASPQLSFSTRRARRSVVSKRDAAYPQGSEKSAGGSHCSVPPWARPPIECSGALRSARGGQLEHLWFCILLSLFPRRRRSAGAPRAASH